MAPSQMPFTQFLIEEKERDTPNTNAFARRTETDHHFPKAFPAQSCLYTLLLVLSCIECGARV